MNLSAKAMLAVRERDGDPADDRPDYVDQALTMPVRLGYREGLPVVSADGGDDTDRPLGGSVDGLYEHYHRGESLLRPDAGTFLQRLADQDPVTSLQDAADELNTDVSTVRRACELHGVELPEDDDDDDGETLSELQLPSGESIPLPLLADDPWCDKLVLAQLLATDGMGVEEAAQWLSHELDENVSSHQVRQAAEDANLLAGDGSPERHQPRGDAKTVGDDHDATPWP